MSKKKQSLIMIAIMVFGGYIGAIIGGIGLLCIGVTASIEHKIGDE